MIINNLSKSLLLTTSILSLFLSVRCSEKTISTENRFEEDELIDSIIPEKNQNYFNEEEVRHFNKIYKESISTVLLHKTGWELSDPIITLSSEEKLTLRFDELDSDINAYQYRIIHCDKDWKTSNLNGLDYINGFEENYIENYKYSFNTFQGYVHYWTEFPNENIELTKSGNYIIVVYEEDHPEQPILSRQFFVSENNAQVKPKVKYPSNLDDRNYRQEIDFSIFHNKSDIINPFSNIHVIIEQNHRKDNSIRNLSPNFVKENELVYDYDEENVFDGGNEFRHVDLSNFRLETDRVKSMDASERKYSIEIKPDIKRTYNKYLEIGDANGRFIIKNVNGNDPNLESDYGNVHFSVPYSHPLDKGDLYLYGQLTDWEIKDQYRLKYDYDALAYRTNVYLKQGYYNYTYLYVNDTTKSADISLIEGTHFDTENDYIFKVYYSDPSGFYDRLLLYHTANSRKDF